MSDPRRGLVTGATGYVGSLVVERLLDEGWQVRVLVRSPKKLDEHPWHNRVEVVEGDASNADDVARALEDIDVAWYLLHSMGGDGDFVKRDRELAEVFATAAREQGVSRIVYLGGLHPDATDLSPHLASRAEVGQVLMDSGVPTAVLQAGVLLGAGSASFEMLRHLSERLPAAVAPKWIRNRIQPIASDDAVYYLVKAADLPADVNRTFDIGGPDVVTYAEMMKRYARVHGFTPRLVGNAPVTTPRLAGRWIGLMTPISAELAAPLVASLVHDTVVSERDIDDYIPPPPGGLTGFDAAVREAVDRPTTRRWRGILLAVSGAVAATAVAGSLATDPNSRWYRSLDKPSWQPPGGLFPIVWTALYADIILTSTLRMADDDAKGRDPRAFAAALGTNLLLNAGWSWAFFRGKKLGLSTLVAALLAASSIDLTRRVGNGRPERTVVLSPYAAWTSFATVLTAEIWRRNRRR